MAYQVLARKYRPQRFSDVIGQDHVTRTLANALEQGRIAHGYIFSGHRGIGKTTIARILAMALNCRKAIGSPERPTFEPCGICESCEEIRAGNAVDVIEIDAATNRGIDEIRELRDAARYRPSRDRYKIYILDEAHQITDAAFNALLKTLEEPPDHVIFMMATTQPEDILQTIRSRCQHYSFHAVRFDAILEQLRTIAAEENVLAEDEALALLAEAGDGSMRDALSIMDQAIASAPLENGQTKLEAAPIRSLMGSVPNAVFARLLESVSENNSAAVLTELDRLLNAGNSAVQLARQFVRYLRNVLMACIAGEETELLQLSPDERARAAGSAMLFGEEELTRFLQIMLRTANELTYRQEQRFHLELGVLKLVHLQRLLPIEELLSQLGGAAPARTVSAPQAPRAVPATATATATPAAVSRTAATPPSAAPSPAKAAAPAFSPFERDAERKHAPVVPRASTAAAVLEPNPAPATALPEPPEPKAAPALFMPAAPAAERVQAPRPVEAATPVVAAPVTLSAPAAPEPLPTGTLDLDAMRNAACDALAAAGHTTAATLVGAGEWTETADAVRVEVAAKKVMLGLTINPEADKIARAAMRPFAGQPPRPVQWVPSENGTRQKSADRPAPTGSVQAAALENPLVQQAKQLFGAEVRSVVDLRDKR
jgi:DNA polymerase-3 subunit gamma/tau